MNNIPKVPEINVAEINKIINLAISTLGPNFAKFLTKEILPAMLKGFCTINVHAATELNEKPILIIYFKDDDITKARLPKIVEHIRNKYKFQSSTYDNIVSVYENMSAYSVGIQ